MTKDEILISNNKCAFCDTDIEEFVPLLVLNESDNGYMACKNFPKCKNVITGGNYALLLLRKQGINVYAWKRKCYKCGEDTTVRSYFINVQLSKFFPTYNIPNLGLGVFSSIDKIMMERFDNIKFRNSVNFIGPYAANTCEHCGATQGYYYVVDDPHDINLDDLGEMNKHCVDNIPFAFDTGDISYVKGFFTESFGKMIYSFLRF